MHIGHRRHEQLADDLRTTGVASPLTGDRGHVRTGAPAGDGQSPLPTERLGVGGDPSHRRERVVGAAGNRASGAWR